MAEETKTKKENKVILEREYIVPLRREWIRVQEFRRANRAVKELKTFIAQHMKVYDRDLRKIKVDILVNNEIRFRGMKHPPARIKVKAIKYDNGEVAVKLVEIPKHIEFQIAREAKRELEKMKKPEAKKETVESIKAEADKTEAKQEEKEKETSSKLAEEKIEKTQAKTEKHTSKTNQETPKIQRKALKK